MAWNSGCPKIHGNKSSVSKWHLMSYKRMFPNDQSTYNPQRKDGFMRECQAIYPSLHDDCWKPGWCLASGIITDYYRKCYMCCLSSDLIAGEMMFTPLLCSAVERHQSPSIQKIQQMRSIRKSGQLVLRGGYSWGPQFIYSPFPQNSQLEWHHGFLFTVNLVAKAEALIYGVCTLL